MSTAKNVGCGCVVAGIAAMGFLLVTILLALCFLGGGLMMGTETLMNDGFGEYGTDKPASEEPLKKKWMYGKGTKDDPQVVCIPLRGIIARSDVDEGILSAETSNYASVLKYVRAATRDKKIHGICLLLDTPGGTVTDSDVLADALKRFKAADKRRFVLVLMESMCCSGGYYVAAEADYIMANPTALTGSIGVIMESFNAADLARKIGVRSVVIASGTNKSLLNPLEPVDPEHVKILKRPVEQDYERFVSIVARGRKLPVGKVKPLADGRILSAKDALEAKLIDGLGYMEDAWKKAEDLAKAKDVRIYRYEEAFHWKDIFLPETFMKCGRAFVGGMVSGAESVRPRNAYRVP